MEGNITAGLSTFHNSERKFALAYGIYAKWQGKMAGELVKVMDFSPSEPGLKVSLSMILVTRGIRKDIQLKFLPC